MFVSIICKYYHIGSLSLVCGEDSPTRKRDVLDNTINYIIVNELDYSNERLILDITFKRGGLRHTPGILLAKARLALL